MKDWLVVRVSKNQYWLTQVAVLPNGRHDYLCGFCDGPLKNHVVAFFASSMGAPGSVACSICQYCDLILDDEVPLSDLDTQIELLLAPAIDT